MAGIKARSNGEASGRLRRFASGLPVVPRPGALPAHLQAEPAFVAAARHSQRVRFLRRVIPLASVAAVIFLVARSFFGFIGEVDAQSDGISIQGRKIVMEKPKLSGFKRDGRSYELTASTATQDLKAPNVVDLDTLNARMQTGNDGWANLKGARGTYDSKIELLEVDGGVNVLTETGLDARLKDARVEFKAGTITTDKPVDVRMPQGEVVAESMQVLDNGRRLVFEGRVRSVFVNSQAGEAKTGEKTGEKTGTPTPDATPVAPAQ